MISESELRAKIKAELPAEAFQKKPFRMLSVLSLLGGIVLGSVIISSYPIPWYFSLCISLLIGNCFGSLMLLAHEIGHGATTHSRKLQDLCLYLACWIYCFSPQLWRIWHNQVHHPYTNMEGRDPDTFGTLEEFWARSRFYRFSVKFAPGSGHWLSYSYLFIFFTLQAQAVLWLQSKRLRGFERLQYWRCISDSIMMILFWVILGVLLGSYHAIFIIIIPMFIANFIIMSYIVTNHMLRSLTLERDTLSTTISVSTCKLLDILHFNFSYHVEHHLFPSMSSKYYPLVRNCLKKYAHQHYMAPPHWWALYLIFRTPKVYKDAETFVEPYSGRTVIITDVETMLMDMIN